MTRTNLRYDWYGALIGLGLPLVGTAIEAIGQLHSASAADLMGALAHHFPAFWQRGHRLFSAADAPGGAVAQANGRALLKLE